MATKIKEVMSDQDRREVLQAAVTDSLAVGNTSQGPFIKEVYPDYLVYEVGRKMFRIAYVIDQKGKVVFGEADRVTPHTVYTTVEAIGVIIDEMTTLAGEREDVTEARASLDALLELSDSEDLTEEHAKPIMEAAAVIIAKLKEAPASKIEDGMTYPAAAFAYAPDTSTPQGWMLRMWEDPTKKVTKTQLGKASAALSPGGFRGQKVVIAAESLPGVKRTIRAAYAKLGVDPNDVPRWVKEAGEMREQIMESCEIDISEATDADIAKGVLPVRIIQPGFNSSKQRYYSEASVTDAATIFDGAKMYADHPAEGDRPERSVRDWVATLHNTRVSESGNAVGVAHIHAGWLKEMVGNLYQAGDLKHLGTSINAVGRAVKQTIEGTKTQYVEGLIKTRMQSVDFVTEAGAGGQAGLTESVGDSFVNAELMDVATLREARPDLIEAIEADIKSEIQAKEKAAMELEARVTELEGQLETVTTERDALQEAARVAEAEKVKTAAQTAIAEAVNASDLPDAAKTRLIESQKEATSAEGIAEIITAEATYIATLTDKGKVTNLGPKEEDTTTLEEARAATDKAMGLTKE
jgi:hypothetical protein